MSDSSRTEATLPTLAASLSADSGQSVLSLTILFHPDPERIGDYWEGELKSRRRSLQLGRHQPEFTGPRGSPRGLDDDHVSRQSLQLSFGRDGLQLRRHTNACRCRLNGHVLGGQDLGGESPGGDAIFLEPAQLAEGCVVQLAHTVVLWLHTGPPRGANPTGVAQSLLGRSAGMCALRREIARLGATDFDVLVLGETGAGKEEVARALHRASPRSGRALVPVNMAAIPETLAPSLLFGSARGAFTGAGAASRGFFRQAEGGTLFMDEIGAVPPAIQPQLLRALQQREIQVVGGDLVAVDVRVIAATDSPLDAGDCNFSSALRHRLGSLEIRVPSLRSHREDLGLLLWHFLRTEAPGLGSESLLPGVQGDPLAVARWAELFQRFALYSWPGNIRELANAARQLLVASERQLVMPPGLESRMRADTGEVDAPAETLPERPRVDEAMFRRAHIDSEYEAAATARSLSISRQAVYRLIEDSGEFRLASDVPEKELETALAEAEGDVRQAALTLRVSYQGLRARMRQRGSR
ncbi:sigma-54-dependent Fis family transcriptional regulator [Parahaliea maris]|uniref:Sigma-54-dependent Fis family transcriptional regulator n=1 Tax=Parahaliea maris TaxID=2716870 RepID=A0A5C9A8C6_9GAMM|nr:sigma 54-interacting transcriptional regulator [Parahaliea maris]TXS96302.1 sigma-54-dependent Fis family transcriptional regulator [Parahaliea maris]